MSVKISELAVLAPEDVAAGDVVASVDTSEGGTKQVELSGVLADVIIPELTQAQATDPDSEVFGTVSGEQLAQAVDARTLANLIPAAYDTTQRPNNNTVHQNLTGVPIFVAITGRSSGSSFLVQISEDGSTDWLVVGPISSTGAPVLSSAQFVVPPAWFYRANGTFGTGENRNWIEWRPV